VAYLPGEVVLPPRLTAIRAVRLYTSGREGVDEARVHSLAERFGLDLNRRVGDLSRGNRQKVGVIIAFAPDVDLFVLDEPTSGLDPLLQRTFRDLIAEVTADGRTVLLSSHVMDEVAQLADRVALMRDGRVVSVDAVDQVGSITARTVRLRLRDVGRAPDAAAALAAVVGVDGIDVVGGVVVAEVSGEMAEFLRAAALFDVADLATERPDLEDAFVEFYGGVERKGGR
jgi:ABC-2 type transport system ATP-binding protein